MHDHDTQRIEGSGLKFRLCGERDTPTSLVLMLHGSGSHSENLVSLAERLMGVLPNTLFVVPDAPISYRDTVAADEIAAVERERPDINWEYVRNWVRHVEPASQDEDAKKQAFFDMINPPVRSVGRLTDLLLARYAIPHSALGIYGFSQGGMVALYLGVNRAAECAGVVAHSAQFFGGTEVRSRPRTLLMVGEQELDPRQVMSQVYPIAVEAVRKIELPFEECVCPGLLHGINLEAASKIAEFFVRVLSEEESGTSPQ